MKRDTFAAMRDYENAFHDAFKTHSNDPLGLTNVLGALHTNFGPDAVMIAMANCMKVAYLKIYGPTKF